MTGDHLATRLDELAGCAQRSGDGLRWPRVRQDREARSSDFVPSWCNGSAGFVHLWLAAERVLGDVGYRELAIGAARDALGPTESGVDLCCGLTGRAYALLALYRAKRRRVLAEEGAESHSPRTSPTAYGLAARAQPLQRRPWHGGARRRATDARNGFNAAVRGRALVAHECT